MEQGDRRFGQYLRRLREECRLSLEQVEELSLTYKVRLSSAWLSRFENGSQKLSVDRLSSLAKIYRTSTGSLVERRELERELDELPSIDLTETDFHELQRKGNEFLQRGELKAAFAFYRAAEERALLEKGGFDAPDIGKARLSMAVALSRMGRYQLAEEEVKRSLTLMQEGSPDYYSALLLLAICSLRLGNILVASIYLDVLQRQLDQLPPKDQADILLFTGNVLLEKGRYREAVKAYRKASSCYGSIRDKLGVARSLRNAAISYGKLEDYSRGIQHVEKALDQSRRMDDRQEVARGLQTLGELYYRSGAKKQARAVLYDSIEIARKGDYHDTLFAAYYYVLVMDREAGDSSAASIERVLRGLLPKLDEPLEEAEAFRRMREGRKDA